jgi:hypothetical protein
MFIFSVSLLKTVCTGHKISDLNYGNTDIRALFSNILCQFFLSGER